MVDFFSMFLIDLRDFQMEPDELRERNRLPGWHRDTSPWADLKWLWDVNTPWDDKFLIVIFTNKTWLPQILSDLGVFASNSEVKKNRKEWWRELTDGVETLNFKWCELDIVINP